MQHIAGLLILIGAVLFGAVGIIFLLPEFVALDWFSGLSKVVLAVGLILFFLPGVLGSERKRE